MKIISSQRYRDQDIINEKIDALKHSNATEVNLIVWTTGIDDLCILSGGHHTMEAAKELGLKINYIEEQHPEKINGDDLLEQAFIDSDWYYIEGGNGLVF